MKDSIAPNRYSDAFLIDAVNSAGEDVVGRYPQALHDGAMSTTTEFTRVTALTDSVLVNDTYRKPFVNNMVAQCYELDGEHAGNLRTADYHRKLG